MADAEHVDIECIFCGEEAPTICDICAFVVCFGCSTTCPRCRAQVCNDHFNPMERLCTDCLYERDGSPLAGKE